MAYMKDGKGPYPNKAGEFCGNHLPGSPAKKEWLSRMRYGRPSSCPAGTSDDMAALGYVGLYLKEDSPYRLPEEVPIDTDELTEAVVTSRWSLK